MSFRERSTDADRSRFPGFDVMTQARHWDAATSELVTARLLAPPPIRFFTPGEALAADALFAQLLDLRPEDEVPVVNMVDSRLADDETDGWHYADMPSDAESWRRSLVGLDQDCQEQFGGSFGAALPEQQRAVLQEVQSHDSSPWHELNAAHVWNLWMRYACTAFYSHPFAWSEIGFDGPAYPRGYKNLGVDRREPFEVRDAHPELDPTSGTES